MAVLSILLTVLLVAASVLIVLIVLVQRPKQEGLGAAFGGGALDSALGAHTTDVLQKITVFLGAVFFLSAIGLAMVKTRQYRASAASDVMERVEERSDDDFTIPPELQRLIDGEGGDPVPGLPGEEGDTLVPADDPASLLPETSGLEAPAGEGEAPAAEEAAPVEEAATEETAAEPQAEESPEAAPDGEGDQAQ